MFFNDGITNRETEACSLILRFSGKEGVKKFANVIIFYARPVSEKEILKNFLKETPLSVWT